MTFELVLALLSPIGAGFGAYLGVRIKLAKLEARDEELARRCDENRDDLRELRSHMRVSSNA